MQIQVDWLQALTLWHLGAASCWRLPALATAVRVPSHTTVDRYNHIGHTAVLCSVVLQVEDIIDSGHTLNHLSRVLQQAGASSVKVVALLDKKGRRRVEFFPDYVGWEVSLLCSSCLADDWSQCPTSCSFAV